MELKCCRSSQAQLMHAPCNLKVHQIGKLPDHSSVQAKILACISI